MEINNNNDSADKDNANCHYSALQSDNLIIND